MKKLSLILVLSLLVVLFSGCSPAADPDTTKPGDDGVRQSIVRMTADSTPILDPASHTGNASAIAYANLYDTLVFPTAEGVTANLAEKWEVSDEGNEFTFFLKKGVKFHDGTELTASDVVFTTKRMQTVGEGFAYLYEGIVEDVVAEDDYTVKFILSQPYGPFVSTLCRLYILNEKLVMDNLADGAFGEFGDYGRAWLLQNDAGSGPYQATEMVQNDYFLGTRFPDWHGGWENRENAPEQFKLIYGTESATVRTMMSTQTLEISDMWQSPESYDALEKLPGVSLTNYSTRLVQNVIFNCTLPPMDDINVRKAVSHLLDYDTLLQVALPGSIQPAGPVSSFTAGHVKCTQYNYDIERAKQLIAESQYADTIGDFSVEFLQISDNEFLERVALQLQAAAKEAGINIEIKKATWNIYQERVSRPESAPHITSCNSGPSFNEAGATLESQFHSKTAGSYENSSWIISDELDAQIEDAMSTLDMDDRFAKYAVLQHYVTDELCPTAWLADLVERVAYQEDYVTLPSAVANAKGEMVAYLMGYPFFMPDIEIKIN